MDQNAYKAKFTDDASPGWDAIDTRLAEIYGPGEPDFHFGTLIKFALGGPDPIDGVSVYRRADPVPHLHYISYGMSNLHYDPDAAGSEFSGWGFEFTFRLQLLEKDMPQTDKDLPIWPINMMQNVARYVHQSGNWFEDGHFMPANGPIAAETDTSMVGLLYRTDPTLGQIETPHGHVAFLQMVGLTQAEIDGLFAKTITVSALIQALESRDPMLITDLSRATDALNIPTSPQPPTPEQKTRGGLMRFFRRGH